MAQKKHTIKDIAKMAGVSIGTVDRVLHNRGRVSEQALKKVKEVLKEIDYRPNLIARTLKTGKSCTIAALVPDSQNDEYWLQVIQGLQKAEKELGQYGMVTEQYLFNQFDAKSFETKAHEVLKSKPDGILLTPFFYKESLSFIKTCKKNEIPVITFNTKVEGVEMLSFIGQNLHQSGRLGAHLLDMLQTKGKTLAVVHVDEDIESSMHLSDKEKGFREYFAQADHKIVSLNIANKEEEKQVNQICSDFSDLAGIFVSSSKAYKVASFFKTQNPNLRVIGYDLVSQNISLLKDGMIDILINQNPTQQAFLGLSLLVDYLIFRKDITTQTYLPLDVVTSENYQQYLHEV